MKHVVRTTGRTVLALAAALVISAASAGAAQATEPSPLYSKTSTLYMYYMTGKIKVAHGGVQGSTSVFVCDDDVDGHTAYISYNDGGDSGRLNAPSQSCSYRGLYHNVSKYKVCIDVTWAEDPCVGATF